MTLSIHNILVEFDSVSNRVANFGFRIGSVQLKSQIWTSISSFGRINPIKIHVCDIGVVASLQNLDPKHSGHHTVQNNSSSSTNTLQSLLIMLGRMVELSLERISFLALTQVCIF